MNIISFHNNIHYNGSHILSPYIHKSNDVILNIKPGNKISIYSIYNILNINIDKNKTNEELYKNISDYIDNTIIFTNKKSKYINVDILCRIFNIKKPPVYNHYNIFMIYTGLYRKFNNKISIRCSYYLIYKE